MLRYILQRVLYAIPILLGVNIITFLLFFTINSPDDMARAHLGDRHIQQAEVDNWKASHGYDKPLFINYDAQGVKKISQTLLFEKSLRLFMFDFGYSYGDRDIKADVKERMWPSLAIAVPALLIGLLVNITFAMLMAFFRASHIDTLGVVICLAMMSISTLFYIIAGQYLISKMLHWVPISGYSDGLGAWKFIILPVIVGIISGLGAGARWYRTLYLEEMGKDYVRTARAKGLSDGVVLFKHVFKNALIPILTGVVVLIPLLLIGSLLLESFFAIPGLGTYMIDAIAQQDFPIVRAMVFLGALLYIAGLILTDISYTWVDPRVRIR